MNREEFEKAVCSLGNNLYWRLVILATVYACVIFISNKFFVDYDSTDGHERSGMELHVDNLSGCHYLSLPKGGITPRILKGEHYCVKDKENEPK